MDAITPALQLLLIPVVGLLWRISGQLAHLAATSEAHAGRLQTLERLTMQHKDAR